MQSVKNANNAPINYSYNNQGNIETIKQGNELIAKYYYDEIGQLIRENNKQQEKTITYQYDKGGNILSKKEYAYTDNNIDTEATKVIEYIYNNSNWKDQLTSFNGKQITYDEIGNPLTYDGMTFTWQNGRELSKLQSNSKNLTISYKYNDDGIRTEKTVNGETSTYYLNGAEVIYETTGNDTIYYQYDSDQNLIGFKYNNTQYYYIKNGQNDIIGILDNELNQIVSYTYDSWGKLLSIKDGQGKDISNDKNHIGYKNPYRYRGYRYDTETGLYYLQSRYYNPEWARFINEDELTSNGQGILEHNMYAYCNNNPINMSDYTGTVAGTIAILTGIVNTILKAAAYTVATVVAIVTGAQVAQNVSSGAKSSTKTKSKSKRDKNAREHTVYQLLDNSRKVQYVGRTVDPEKTKARHNSNPARINLKFEIIRSNLNWYEARALEQYFINFYKTKNKGNPMNNQINGLRETYWNRPEFSDYIIYGLKALSPEDITYVGK